MTFAPNGGVGSEAAAGLTVRWFSRAPDTAFTNGNAPIGSPAILVFGEMLVIDNSAKGARVYITLPQITPADEGVQFGITNLATGTGTGPGDIEFNTHTNDLMDAEFARASFTKWAVKQDITNGPRVAVWTAFYDSAPASGPAGGLWVQTRGVGAVVYTPAS